MTPSDQHIKLRIVLYCALFGLLGFLLEVSPVGGVFGSSLGGPPVFTAFTWELQSLGFLAYLALAAAAAVGLHLAEKEPVPKEPEEKKQDGDAAQRQPSPFAPEMPEAPDVAERTYPRVRPETHQLRMMASALLGYSALKWMSLTLMGQRFGLDLGHLSRLFETGLIFTALGWLLLWQFLRWYAAERQWIRLQEELIGGDVARPVALAILIKPLLFAYAVLANPLLVAGTRGLLVILLYLSLSALAVILWHARPGQLTRTLSTLAGAGIVFFLITLALGIVEQRLSG